MSKILLCKIQNNQILLFFVLFSGRKTTNTPRRTDQQPLDLFQNNNAAHPTTANIYQQLTTRTTADHPSTSKFTGESHVNELQQQQIDDSEPTPANNSISVQQDSSIPITYDNYVEKILATFFLKKTTPNVKEKEYLCSVTEKDLNFIENWFFKSLLYVDESDYMKENQLPLALFYFKQTPTPTLDEITEFSARLHAERLAVYRWFNKRREELNLQSSNSVYSFDYSPNDIWWLELIFMKNKSPSFEQIIDIGKIIKLDEVKVDHWFAKKQLTSGSRKVKTKNKTPNSRDKFAKTPRQTIASSDYLQNQPNLTKIKLQSFLKNRQQKQSITRSVANQAGPSSSNQAHQINQIFGRSMVPMHPTITPNQFQAHHNLNFNQRQPLLNPNNPFDQRNHLMQVTRSPTPFYNNLGNYQNQQFFNMNDPLNQVMDSSAAQQSNIAPFPNSNQTYGNHQLSNRVGLPNHASPRFNNLPRQAVPASAAYHNRTNPNSGFTQNLNQTSRSDLSDQPTQFIANNKRNQDSLNRGIHEINMLLEKYKT